MKKIEKYIEKLKAMKDLYDVGTPQNNSFGIAINEAKKIITKNMRNLKNVEVFFIEEPNKDGEMFAWISFQDVNHEKGDINNGYDHMRVPVKLRPIQKSIRDNVLVNQSEQYDMDSVPTTTT